MNTRFKIVAVGLTLLMALTGTACGGDNVDEGYQDGKYQSGAEIYFPMEDSDSLREEKTNGAFPLHYIFSQAKYKSPQEAGNVRGVRGKSVLFDGYSTYADTMQTREYESFTVSVWAAPRAFDTRTDGRGVGLLSSYDDMGGFELGVYSYGAWGFRARTDMGSVQIRCDSAPLDLYTWNYLTAVFDGAGHKLTLYKNGKKVAESSCPGSKALASVQKLRIGATHDTASMEDVFMCNIFSGLIDEVEIYGSALTEKQIAEKYAALNEQTELDVYHDLWLDYAVLADDRYAPQYHLRMAQNWQNETYGFFYYNGYYHAFCQQNALAPYYTDGQRWGHFVSTDLVHWESLVPALVPEENGIDNNQVFSGGAAIDENGEPVIFYTGVNYESPYLNLISTARPSDLSDAKLENWTKSGKVVVDQGEISTPYNFRDPFIYRENGTYYMLVGGTDRATGDGAVYCYRATDGSLEEWEYLSCLYSGNRSEYPVLGTCYELPNLFRLENESKTISKYLLMISPIGGTVNGVYYWLGDFDPETGIFTPEQEEPSRYDIGPVSQVLCPSGFYDERTDRNLFLTMSRTGMSAQERLESGWTNVMTLVKELRLDDAGKLCIRPIEEYASLYAETLVDAEGSYSIEEANALLEMVAEDMLMIRIEVNPGGAEKIGLNVKYDHGGGEYVDISCSPGTEEFWISAARSSLDMRNNGAGGGTVPTDDGTLVFTVYVDRSMVEAYLNDANQATVFGYNTSYAANGVRIYSEGGQAVIRSIAVHRLNSAYGTTVPAYWGT